MRAAESRFFGRKSRGRGGNPAYALARLLSALAGILLPLPVSKGPSLRKLMVVAVAASLALAPLPAAVVADAPDNAGYASLTGQEAAEHGHSHDDEGAADHSAAHEHGHDPADHSHQYAFLTGSSSQWGLPPVQRWPSALSGRLDGALGLGIDRPPKQAMSI
jgi:hypothetical protein